MFFQLDPIPKYIKYTNGYQYMLKTDFDIWSCYVSYNNIKLEIVLHKLPEYCVKGIYNHNLLLIYTYL